MKIGNKTKVTKELTRKEINRRNNIKRLTISAIVGVVIFIALAVALNSINNKEETKKVYQVAHNIPIGTKITEQNFDSLLALKEIQISLIPEGYLVEENKDSILNMYTEREYKTNDIITKDALVDTENEYIKAIENPVEVSFSLGDISTAVAGTVRAGEYVNVYGLKSVTKTENDGAFSSREIRTIETQPEHTFKHLLIKEVFNGDGTEIKKTTGDDKKDEESNKPTTLFITVISEKDVDTFNEMLANCDIRMAKVIYDNNDTYLDFINNMNKETGHVDNNADTTEQAQQDTQSDDIVDTTSTSEEITEGETDEADAEIAEELEEAVQASQERDPDYVNPDTGVKGDYNGDGFEDVF